MVINAIADVIKRTFTDSDIPFHIPSISIRNKSANQAKKFIIQNPAVS